MASAAVAAKTIAPVDVPRASETPVSRRLSRQVAADMVAIGDMTSVVLGGLLPALVYALIGDAKLNQVMILQSALLAGFIAYFCLRYRGMYDTSRMDAFPQSPIELFIAMCCALVGVLGIGLPLVLNNNALIALWYAAWLTSGYSLILLNRLAARAVLRALTKEGRFDQRVAVYGAGPIARRVHDFLTTQRLGVYFSGVFDDRIGQDRINPEGLVVSGKLEELIADCRAGKVDRIIIALPATANQRLAAIVEKFESLPVSTHVVTHIASDMLETDNVHNVSNLGPIGLLDIKKKP